MYGGMHQSEFGRGKSRSSDQKPKPHNATINRARQSRLGTLNNVRVGLSGLAEVDSPLKKANKIGNFLELSELSIISGIYWI